MKTQNQKPPRLAEWLVKTLFPDHGSFSTIGDLAEVYQSLALRNGFARARIWYWFQAIRTIPAFINNLFYWSAVMLKNYFKVAYRNLVKNRLSSAINILGLSAAIGCSIVVFLFIEDQYGKDAFHENAEQIFLVELLIDRSGRQQLWGDTPLPLGPAMQADFPQIKRAVRVDYNGGAMRYGDKVFNENIMLVEPEYLQMFTFPLKEGDKNALYDKNKIILSAEVAERYFGDEQAEGKQVSIKFKGDRIESFIIGGVAEKFPKKKSFAFNILMAYDWLFDLGALERGQENDWSKWTNATLIQLENPNDLAFIEKNMDKYKKIQNEASENWAVTDFVFDNLLNLSLNSYKVRGDIASGDNPVERITLFVIGLFLLLLACFNYVNIALASAGTRLKEIGVRKVIGSKKLQLVHQFLGENVLICLIALTIGVTLAHFFFIPAWNGMFDGENLSLDFGTNLWLWMFFVGLLLFTGFVAGAYPSFFVAAFNPINIFRGKQRLGGRNLFTRILLSVQFTLSLMLVAAGVVFKQNADFQKDRDWGYNQKQTIVVPINGEKHYTQFNNIIRLNANVISTSPARFHVGRNRAITVVEVREKKYEVGLFEVGFDYFETLGFRLNAGRFFDRAFPSDAENAIVVNETFVRHLGFDEPVGQSVRRSDTTSYTIVGVTEDFHYNDFRSAIDPVIFRMSKAEDYNYLAVTTEAGTVLKTAEYLEKTWKAMFPDSPYSGFFQDEVFAFSMRMAESVRKLFIFIAVVALAISCMGLFGLVSLNIEKRRKEFSIRKVLGASMRNVAALVNKEFAVLLAIATLIAAPAGYFILDMLLDQVYQYRVPMSAAPFIFAAVMVFLTAAITVSSHIYKVAASSPVEGLRSE